MDIDKIILKTINDKASLEEYEALELCEENRFCIKNQENLLKRIENDNISKRQEAASKLAKLRLSKP